MNVAVSFYTGEYANLLVRLLWGAGCWVHALDRMVFDDGYAAGADDRNPETDEAWVNYLKVMRDVPKDPYVMKGVDDNDLETSQTVLLIRGERAHLKRALDTYMQALVKDAHEGRFSGSDDSVYDYFPDAVEAGYQLALAIDTRWAYVSGVQRIEAIGSTYHNHPEVTFPVWPANEEKPATT